MASIRLRKRHNAAFGIVTSKKFKPHTTQFVGKSLCAAQCHSILKLSCMIADLARSEEIPAEHLAEALHALQPSQGGDGKRCLARRLF